MRGVPRGRRRACPRSARATVVRPRRRRGSTSRCPARRPRRSANRACARCHQVLFSRYPFTWEGGRRDAIAGGSHINSGEARDFLLGGCSRRDGVHRLPRPPRRRRRRHAASPRDAGEQRRLHRMPPDAGAARGAPRPRAPRPGRRRWVLRRLPHAAQEHGARRDAHALPPHRVADRRGARPRRPPPRMRALPRRSQRSVARRHDGSLVARPLPAAAPRGALRLPRRQRHPCDPRARQAARAGGGDRDSSARPARPTRRRAIARELLDEYPLVREWAKRSLAAIRGRCDVDLSASDDAIARGAGACAGTAAEPRPPPAARPSAPREEDPED